MCATVSMWRTKDQKRVRYLVKPGIILNLSARTLICSVVILLTSFFIFLCPACFLTSLKVLIQNRSISQFESYNIKENENPSVGG